MGVPLSTVIIQAADAVSNASSMQEVYDAALQGVRDVTGIDRASILLFDPDGVMRFKAWSGISDEYRAAVEGHTPWVVGDTPGPPLVVPNAFTDPSLTSYLDTFRREDICALAFVPIVSRRTVIGKFMLYRREPDAFDRGELDDVLAIAYHIGFAVERLGKERDAIDARQRTLFALDAALMGTWEWEIASGRVRWSDNLERIHGLPPGSFTGEFSSYEREIHPDDRGRVLASLDRAVREGTPHDVEYRIVAPDGTVRHVSGKGRVETDASGRPIRVTGVCMDITGRKRVEAGIEQALRQEAEVRKRLELLTQGAQRLLASPGADSVVQHVIELACSVLSADGYAVWRRTEDTWSVAASRGLSETFVSHPVLATPSNRHESPLVAEDAATDVALEARRTAYAAEGIVSLVSIPLSIHGEYAGSIVFYYRSTHRPAGSELQVATALGQLASAAISNADLYAEQQRLRREAQADEVRAAFLAEASVLLTSLDYKRDLERLAELVVPRLSDWCSVDLVTEGGGVERLIVVHTDPGQVECARELHERYPVSLDEPFGVGLVLRTGKPQLYPEVPDHVVDAVARDGEHLRLLRQLRLRSVMIVPVSSGRRTFGAMSLVCGDSTRRFSTDNLEFAMELARRAGLAIDNARLFHEARDANRLKDEFLATLSHELRTPLNVILGRTRRLTAVLDDRDALRRNIETIDRNATALTRLVDDLLDVSRFTLGQVKLDLETVDLNAVVNAVTSSLEPTARVKGVSLQVEMSPELPSLYGDSTRLQQVVWNLLTNAIKFTPAGNAVTVRLEHSGSHAVLIVADEGSGIPPEFLPHVFDMFRQAESGTSRQHGGLGLGLSIVRRLVELHGGYVTATSDGPGRGATFRVALPTFATRAAARAAGIAAT